MKKVASFILVASTMACSIGTEVGNGVRPRRDDPSPTPGSPKNNSAPSADPMAPESSNNYEDTKGSPASTHTTSIPGTSKGADGSPPMEWLWRTVTAPCASPWAEALRSPVTLQGDANGSSALLEATLDPEGWRVRLMPGDRTATLRPARDLSPFAVTLTSSESATISRQCSSVSTTTSTSASGVPITERSATITFEGSTFRLKWTLGGTANPRTLETVQVTSPRGEVITLKPGP